jgi:hypothetical protein
MVANSARNAASFAVAPVSAGRADGSDVTIVVRADSAYYSAAFYGTVRRVLRHGPPGQCRFSVTVRIDP